MQLKKELKNAMKEKAEKNTLRYRRQEDYRYFYSLLSDFKLV